MRKRAAFTLIELLVVISILSVLVMILVPVVDFAMERARRAACQTNLKTIGGAFRDYEYSRGTPGFPRLAVNGDVDGDLGVTNDLQVGAPPAYNTAELGTNTMQNVWLLIVKGYLLGNAFHCSSDRGWEPRRSHTRYGWENTNEFSYGMQNPYAKSVDLARTNNADPTQDSYMANWVLMADLNPGGAVDGVTRSHKSHTGDGFNYMTRNGSVDFHDDEGNSIFYGEEIYTDDNGTGDGYGDDADDVIITPTNPRPG